MTDLFLPLTNLFLPMTNLFLPMTNLFLPMTKLFLPMTKLFLPMTNRPVILTAAPAAIRSHLIASNSKEWNYITAWSSSQDLFLQKPQLFAFGLLVCFILSSSYDSTFFGCCNKTMNIVRPILLVWIHRSFAEYLDLFIPKHVGNIGSNLGA